jgi:sec-independent protein translocase protein TatC
MPGLDLGHLVVIFFIAFLVLGPTRMVEVARGLGKFYQQTRVEWVKFSQSFQAGLEESPTETSAESSTPATTTDTPAPSDTIAAVENTETTAVASDASAITSTPNIDTTPSPATSVVPQPLKKRKKKKPPKSQAQSISDHLVDLRAALVRSILAIVILTMIAYIFSDAILFVLRAPAGDIKLQALSPMDGFIIKFRVALYGGLFLSAPVWIFELMRFIAPALLPHEKRLIVPGIVAAMVLFLLGNAFGYYMLKGMMSVILGMFGQELAYFPSADPFISFVVFFLVATGISFELPIIMLIFIRIGWISHQTLRRQRKIAYFIIFVFAELITPVADPFIAPMIVMVPMVILFELALLVARVIAPKPSPATVPPATL